jgi:hypothetical protein
MEPTTQTSKPKVTARLDAQLRWTAAVLSMVSLGALVTQVLGILPMVYFLTFFGVPATLLLFVLAAYAKWIDERIFLRAIYVGLIGGALAVLTYDGVRLLLMKTAFTQFNSFASHYIFGSWITGKDINSTAAAIAGWTYHYWNGLAIALFYVLAFGRRHWLYAVGWAMFLEACMLGLFPMFMQVTNKLDFIVLSMVGHICYGIVLGLIAQKYALNWGDAA